MYPFLYQRPTSLDDALKSFRSADDACYLAGGQTLLPVMKQRLAMPSDVIDLASIGELRGFTVAQDRLSIGAMTSHAVVAQAAEIKSCIPGLSHLAGTIGDPHVRNRGTLGGSIANNDPAADYPAALVALDAVIHTDRREIAAADFFKELFETALEGDELVVRVEFPLPQKSAYIKFPNPASRYAMVGVFAAVVSGAARLAATGARSCVFRLHQMEQALDKNFDAAALAGHSLSAEGLTVDMHASAEYRAHLIGVLARRAVDAANGRGSGS